MHLLNEGDWDMLENEIYTNKATVSMSIRLRNFCMNFSSLSGILIFRLSVRLSVSYKIIKSCLQGLEFQERQRLEILVFYNDEGTLDNKYVFVRV